jgi:2-iminobutanoate/2-iminopropanoate deaminase
MPGSAYALKLGVGLFLGLHRGSGDDFTNQFDDTFKYIEKTLVESGLTLAHLVKVNVWLKHIEDLPQMEKRFYINFKEDRFSARMTSTTFEPNPIRRVLLACQIPPASAKIVPIRSIQRTGSH